MEEKYLNTVGVQTSKLEVRSHPSNEQILVWVDQVFHDLRQNKVRYGVVPGRPDYHSQAWFCIIILFWFPVLMIPNEYLIFETLIFFPEIKIKAKQQNAPNWMT